VSKKEAISGALNLLSGATTRHNKALREVSEWSETIQKFITVYYLYGGSSFSLLLENIGHAKFDLTAIAYKGRPLINRAMKIKGDKISPLVSEILNSVENLRRHLLNPSLQNKKINETIINLRSSHEKLKGALAEIELM